MRKDDLIHLRHMLDAAKEAMFFIKGRNRNDLDVDRMLVLALVKEIEIIGEAASKVSAEVRLKNADIPWLDIIDMRNHLIHAYYDVDLDIVWDTVTQDISPLIARLEKIVSSEERL